MVIFYSIHHLHSSSVLCKLCQSSTTHLNPFGVWDLDFMLFFSILNVVPEISSITMCCSQDYVCYTKSACQGKFFSWKWIFNLILIIKIFPMSSCMLNLVVNGPRCELLIIVVESPLDLLSVHP